MSHSTTPARRALALVAVAALVVVGAGAARAQGKGPKVPGATGVQATVAERAVDVAWQPPHFSPAYESTAIEVLRNGASIATLPGDASSYHDADVSPGSTYSYQLVSRVSLNGRALSSAPTAPVTVMLPAYLVGAATADITPPGVVNQGGNGLGDGRLFPSQVVSRGSQNQFQGEHIMARAMVVDDGDEVVAIADIETQGMFAAYQDGPWGLADMAAQVASDIPALPADHILIASDHTHSGPDTIGAWGGVSAIEIPGYEGPNQYLRYIKDQTVKAIEDAFASRRFADIRAGESDASTLIYNQSCSEALNQSKEETYPGPEVCATPGKDGMMRVVQATGADGSVIVTYMAYAAHATAGGGAGVHGDWPQFLSEAMGERYGGVGLAMEGAVGGTQPCRPTCSFTDPDEPGYNVGNRRAAYTLNYMSHVEDALTNARAVSGPVRAAQAAIREVITGPAVTALFLGGQYAGARLLRSHENPWVVGNTIRTIASAVRVGDVLFAGTPGEGFYAIGNGIREATDARLVIQLGLANDQLGYLIAPVHYVPIIAAEAPVNDNIIFNVSPTIGDHVMCTDIRLALSLGFDGASPAQCLPYDVQDAAGDPVAEVPVGGVVLPDVSPAP